MTFKFQGALQVKVYHGCLNLLGCLLTKQTGWHKVISDPRKNMLIDLKNESSEDSEKDFTVVLDDKSEIKISALDEGCSVIAIKEYQKYSDAEDQFLLPSDIGLKNISTKTDTKKSIFNLNKSWKDSLSAIVTAVSENKAEVILINGVVNSGKSTFATCLINQLLSRTQREVFVMDLDPGQPNYNLAGQLSLLRMNDFITTNADYKDIEHVKGYYLNTPTPNLNMKYYQNCTAQLFQDYQSASIAPSKQSKCLIVNTCGWVEGLGSDIQLKIVDTLMPQIIVTMTKHQQGLNGNDFSKTCRVRHGFASYIDVVNDPIEGSTNVKGAVQRNRKIINSLAQNEPDRYLFNQASVDGQNQLPVKFESKAIKRDDFSLSKSQAFKIQCKPFQTVPFSKVSFCLIREQSEQVSSKIETLRFFNCQIIAAVKLDNAQFQSIKQFDDLRIIDIPFKKESLPPLEIKFYGLIRDIDFMQGLKIIPQDDLQIKDMDFNAIVLAHDSIFKFPSSYLMQDDTQEMLMRQQIANQSSGRSVMNTAASTGQEQGINQNNQQRVIKYFMADLNPKKD